MTQVEQALVTLSRLAGASSVFVFAFDQLEGLQMRPDDPDGLRAFADGVAKLFVACRNVAAISCVQIYFKQDLEQAVAPAHMHRIAQDQGALTLLAGPHALELVERRLAAQAEQRGTARRCLVELKLGRTAPEADLLQACLYHLLLSAEAPSDPQAHLALVAFEPDLHEHLFAPGQLVDAQAKLKALISRLAGRVLSPSSPTALTCGGRSSTRRVCSSYSTS